MARRIDLSVPWVATLNGNSLSPFGAYNDLVTDNETPSAALMPNWSKKAHAADLEAVPEGAKALWDSVLALYRLSILPDRGRTWEDHVCAWLVRGGRRRSGEMLTDRSHRDGSIVTATSARTSRSIPSSQ